VKIVFRYWTMVVSYIRIRTSPTTRLCDSGVREGGRSQGIDTIALTMKEQQRVAVIERALRRSPRPHVSPSHRELGDMRGVQRYLGEGCINVAVNVVGVKLNAKRLG
jgi:hypothetical protein